MQQELFVPNICFHLEEFGVVSQNVEPEAEYYAADTVKAGMLL
jgi:hypothetical protein